MSILKTYKNGAYWRIDNVYYIKYRIKKYDNYWLLSIRNFFNRDIMKPIKRKTKKDCDIIIRECSHEPQQ